MTHAKGATMIHQVPLKMIVEVAGVEQEIRLIVRYLVLPACMGACDEPPHRESVEVLSVLAPTSQGEPINIDWMLDRRVIKGIERELLPARELSWQ
jgi:hypothetical protein